MADDFKVLKQIAALESKTVDELTKLWSAFYEYEQMSYSKSYLISKISYKIQELAFGSSHWKPENALNRWPLTLMAAL